MDPDRAPARIADASCNGHDGSPAAPKWSELFVIASY